MQAEINGNAMGYVVYGEGPALVLIHGFGLDRSIWGAMVQDYLGEVCVVLPDVRGHGESAAPPGSYSMSLLAADIAGLLEHLEIDRAVIAGHSMGGYITLAFAADHRDRMAGMGLITTRAEADSDEKAAGRHKVAVEVAERGAIALAESLAPRLTEDAAIQQAMHGLILKTDPQGIIGALKGMAARPDRRDFLEMVSLPSLVIAGERDQIIDLQQARRMAEHLPDGRFVSLPECGHMPMLEDPQGLAKGLRDLMAASHS
jgi:pimeloyl-ACP methyl ester carboxylesterase